MCLMTKPKIFDVFIVDAESESFYLPEKTTVGLTQKSCGIEPELKTEGRRRQSKSARA